MSQDCRTGIDTSKSSTSITCIRPTSTGPGTRPTTRSTPSSPWPTPCATCASATSPPKIFDSGLGISLFRDNSTRTRFSFASACNLLGLEVQDPRREEDPRSPTARPSARPRTWSPSWPTSSASATTCTSVKGHEYQKTFMDARGRGLPATAFWSSSPTLVNLQCDVDHPTQCMADMLHIIHYFGGVENLKGKKVAMTWAYSPQLRQAPVRSAGRHRPVHPLRHGRGAGPSGGLRRLARGRGDRP